MKDKFGNELKSDDRILYATKLGRSPVLRLGTLKTVGPSSCTVLGDGNASCGTLTAPGRIVSLSAVGFIEPIKGETR